MTLKNLAYDNPAYLAVLPIPLWGGTGTSTFSSSVANTLIGASGQSNKFVAFTNMLVKSITASAVTIGTSTVSSNNAVFYRITNNGTTAVNTVTATYTLVASGIPGPNGSAVTTAAYQVVHLPGTGVSTSAATVNTLLNTTTIGSVVAYTIPLLPGDIGYITKGTDATEALVVTAETVIQPLANVTL